MLLKRKRSDSELSTSTTSTFNSPPRINAFSPQSTHASMDTDDFTFTAHYPVSPLSRFSNNNLHIPGRTMKRLRDNRPSENEVHQRTLDMLYSAQRQHAHGTSNDSHHQKDAPVATHPASSSSSSASSSHQRNLHSFWNLPSRPSALPAACLPPITIDTPTECEDCGQKLCGDDESMMDVDDGSGATGTSCGACHKHVCSHCSITNLGESRWCLGCAGRSSRAGVVAKDNTPWARGMSNWLC